MQYEALYHSGTPHEGNTPHSGRFKYGSGEDPYQGDPSFRAQVDYWKKQGKTETETAKILGMSTTEYRKQIAIAKEQEMEANIRQVMKLKEHGYSNMEIGRRMGVNESLVRSWYIKGQAPVQKKISNTAEVLDKMMREHKYLDVSSGAELELGVSEGKFKAALKKLKDEDRYDVVTIYPEQVTNPGKQTTMSILCPKGTTKSQLYTEMDQIDPMIEYCTRDGGKNYLRLADKPAALDGKRVFIRYGEEGVARDGTIEIRRGVEDISLGDNTHYAQVRVNVDNKYYLKGMAHYSDDIPDGYDVVFNTNKAEGTPPADVFKPLKTFTYGDNKDEIDWGNPFGATIKANGQRHYTDPVTGEDKLSVINKVNEEGDWGEWSKTISAQMLGKQPKPLIQAQLKMSLASRKDEFNDIMQIQNPEVKKKLLESFASSCDSDAVHLRAAGFPNQRAQVLLPVPAMKDNEIYAPNYPDGSQVALIRYPHGGIFEIPILTVNNRRFKAHEVFPKDSLDAVGVNKNVADRLSGADFDGDTVQVIPLSDNVRIKNSEPLKGLIGFDPKEAYRGYEGMKIISPSEQQRKMGEITNLITDMTVMGAPPDEIERAVRHSMCIIDAKKHKLDYKRSYIENGIAELRAEYQPQGGAGTLLSRAKNTALVNERKEISGITTRNTDPETGERIIEETGKFYEKNGKKIYRKEQIYKMAKAKDARELLSGPIDPETGYGKGTPAEILYANYANGLKNLANEARKAYLSTGKTEKNQSAKDTYSREVSELEGMLQVALMNAPKEREAQRRATQIVKAKVAANPELKFKDEEHKKELKKVQAQALAAARTAVGSGKKGVQIEPTTKQWNAIKSGAFSSNKINQLLANIPEDKIKKAFMPNYATAMTLPTAKQARIKAMSGTGLTNAEIAEALGISVSTVSKYARGKNTEGA